MPLCGLFFVALSLVQSVTAASSSAAGTPVLIAEVVRNGSVVVRDVEFAKGNGAPTPQSRQALRAVRAMLLEHDEWTFEVRVYCGESGDAARDRALAASRAKSVVEYLISEGVRAARLVPRGYALPPQPESAARNKDGRDRVELKKLNEE
jgi:outer membrane protein OmpA-like peptidoglycan-associated protein